MGMNRTLYPTNFVVGVDLHDAVSKDAWIALAVDLLRQLFGDNLSDEEVRALLVERLDILKQNGIVPTRAPMRFPRTPGTEGQA